MNKFYSLWISVICILVFLLQSIFPYITNLLILNNLSFIQPYRFVTSIFLHGSTLHLIYNLFALVMFGLILESQIGSKKFLIIFLASGIFANLIAVNFYSSSLGMSGAILGVIGCLTIIKPLIPVWAFSLPMPLFIATLLWTIGDILGLFIPSDIGHIAHISGLAIGIISGIILRKNKPKTIKQKIKIPEHYMQYWENRFMKKTI